MFFSMANNRIAKSGSINKLIRLKPRLHIHLFGFSISAFQFFGVLGYFMSLVLCLTIAYLNNLVPFVILLMGIVGAFTFFILTYGSKIFTGKESIVYYHHEITILLLCSVVLYLLKMPVLRYLDITLLGIGVFLSFGRMGCYSVGCCHGRPFKGGVKYGEQHVQAGFTWYYNDVALFPIQLIESVYVAGIVTVGVFLLFNGAVPGTVLIFYTVVYGLLRYLLEFFRGDPERPIWQGLTEAQWTTFALTATTLGLGFGGILPLYSWHLIEFVLMFIISVAVIITYMRKGRFAIFTVPHIQQLADALVSLEKLKGSLGSSTSDVTTYVTKMGLCISFGILPKNNNQFSHYTVSSVNSNKLNILSARKLATVIGQLRKHSSSFDLIDNQNGIYHIILRNRNFKKGKTCILKERAGVTTGNK